MSEIADVVIDIVMKERNATNNGWVIEHPKSVAKNIDIADAGNVITATTVEGAIQELFTNANNGKTAIANAVNAKGIPATLADTFAVLAGKIGTASLVNTADATALANEILVGKTGYKNGAKVTGTMPVRGPSGGNGGAPNWWTPSEVSATSGRIYLRPKDGASAEVAYQGDVWLSATDPNFTPNNLKNGLSIFGLMGTNTKLFGPGDVLLSNSVFSAKNNINLSMAVGTVMSKLINRIAGAYMPLWDPINCVMYAVDYSNNKILNKLDSSGNVIWSRTCTGNINPYPPGRLRFGFDGNIIIQYEQGIMKVTPSNVVVYDKATTLCSGGGTYSQLMEDKDGNFISVRRQNEDVVTLPHTFAKYNSNLVEIWNKGLVHTYPIGIDTDNSGNIYLTDNSSYSTSATQYIQMTNPSGDVVYNKAAGPYWDGYAYYQRIVSSWVQRNLNYLWVGQYTSSGDSPAIIYNASGTLIKSFTQDNATGLWSSPTNFQEVTDPYMIVGHGAGASLINKNTWVTVVPTSTLQRNVSLNSTYFATMDANGDLIFIENYNNFVKQSATNKYTIS